MRRSRRLAVVAATAAAGTLAALAGGPGIASIVSAAPPMGVRQQLGQPGDESKDIKSAVAQFGGARTAPGNLAPGAYTAAYDHVRDMDVAAADNARRPEPPRGDPGRRTLGRTG